MTVRPFSNSCSRITTHRSVIALDLKAKGGDFSGRIFVRMSPDSSSPEPAPSAMSFPIPTVNFNIEQINRNRQKLAPASPVVEPAETGAEIAGAGEELAKGIGEIVSRLKPIVEIVDEFTKAAKKLRDTDHEVDKLVKAMVDLYSSAGEIGVLKERIKTLNDTVVDIAHTTEECAQFLDTYTSTGALARAAQLNFLNKHREKIDALSEKLSELKEAFDRNVGMQTLLHAGTLKQTELLKSLSPLDLDASQRSPCLERTRTDVLEKIISWLAAPPADSNILWLSGVAGSGKSTIAASIAKYFREQGALGAFVFFSRNKESSPRSVLHGIAQGLAMLNQEFKSTLCSILEQKPSIVNADINSQFQELLLNPLHATRSVDSIVILDALDECSDDSWRRTLISLITDAFPRFPCNIRFLITSRRNRDISAPFVSKPHITELFLNISDKETKTDILVYLDHRFKEIRAEQSIQNDHWPESQSLQTLAEYAGGLFIWAATACNLILDAYEPDDALNKLLAKDSNVENNLDGLYTVALETSGKWNDVNFAIKAAAVLAAVVLARVPLTDKSLDSLLGFLPGDSAKVLSQLGCVIQWAPNQTARTLHASFADYLVSSKRSGTQPWFVNAALGHRYLAQGCLEVLQKELQFNICNLESSYVLNSEVKDLETRIQQFISPELSYASRFWTSHLDGVEIAEQTDSILVAVKNCFPGHFLYWLEVLSLLGYVNIAHTNLDIPRQMLHGKDSDLESFFHNAQDFVDGFGPVIAQSVPHIYLSAVPFSAKESLVYKHFKTKLLNVLKYKWPSLGNHFALRKIILHTAVVYSIVFSPNGKHIASALSDGTVRIWDAATGEVVGEPLKGHTGNINSVVFSPDGKHIASGSNDNTIRIWVAATGEMVCTPLKGHTGWIRSVTFSLDGKHIASGSDDCTVRIWDATTGEAMGAPLTGHTDHVNSAVFSPDGKLIASGSNDNMVRIWDATGKVVGAPLKGHTNNVNSVVFSPDGKYIASGSNDNTVCIWDTMSGKAVGTPLQGHTDWVRSVKFSPDGMHIASGSDDHDHTVCIWDMVTDKVIGGPLNGHTNGVQSVAFSPDGRYIASGSENHTVCIWDVTTGDAASPPLKGHTSQVNSVTFSPDGKHIASGSNDHTVRIWDTETGKAGATVLKGRSSWVHSVTFSPDGKHIAAVSDDSTGCIWDVVTGEVVGAPLKGHTDWVQSVAFSPDGKHLASGSEDSTVRIWDAVTGEAVGTPLKGHTNGVQSVTFSPDGRHIASGSDDLTVRIWDALTHKEVGAPFRGHTSWVQSVAFSPDGKRIASGSNDYMVRIWDMTTGEAVGVALAGHTDGVRSVAFSPNERHIASGSPDSTVRIWDTVMGETAEASLKVRTDLDPIAHKEKALSQDVLWNTSVTFEEGWLKNAMFKRMFWVPPWLRDHFCFPWNSV
ncbi:WD40 repeat-like protein, partial [Mycena pura]